MSHLFDVVEHKQENKENSKLESVLQDLNSICLNFNTAFILCYSGYDMANYIYSLSQNENSSYMEDKLKSLSMSEDILEALCMIEKINKTDATNLLNNFIDIKSVLTSSSRLLSLVPGMNENKIKSIEDFLSYDFSDFNNE